MKYLWVIYEKELKEEGYVIETLIGTYESEEEARDVYTAILLDKPDNVNIEIVIQKTIEESNEHLQFNVIYLEMQMDKLSKLINNQATIINDFQKRIKELEKVSN